ncbi:hypothetical protein [Nonomuraea typhae]|uniref:hypothetical protein n=1 Tax=Nonomuraea typhae TaxID=2603600 RepID=UPI0012FB2987|nr:hypothetical protein [Nonomuraea typhae]
MSKATTAALTTGSATAARLCVAALAATSAYLGFSAYDTANSAPKPAQPVTLQAREVPITSNTPAPAPGVIAVSAKAGAAGCDRTYLARSVVINPEPGTTVLYRWQLSRWSPRSKQWSAYLVDHSGFGGLKRTLTWEPRVADNPGWYRIELTVRSDGKTIKSDRFQVSC